MVQFEEMNTSSLSGEIGWGILGTGGIAHTFAEGLGKCRKGRLVAVGSRKQESADNFVRKFGPAMAYGNYESVLADPTVDVVYISTPHPQHAKWCIKAAQAKKHILCEKPLTMNHEEAQMVVKVAGENEVFLMEAFMYRCHPQTLRIVELIRSRVIGQIGIIRATYSSNAAYNLEDRRFKKALGGGGILDLGCYTTSISRLIAGAAQGLNFSNPEEILGFAQIDPEGGSDIYAVASARFPGGMLAQLSAGEERKELLREWEHRKAQIRARVQHPFRIIKNLFKYRKVRYRGLKKNLAKLHTLFALANLVIAGRILRKATMA